MENYSCSGTFSRKVVNRRFNQTENTAGKKRFNQNPCLYLIKIILIFLNLLW